MSMLSSRRSATPTVTASWSLSRLQSGLPSAGSGSGLLGVEWCGNAGVGRSRRSTSPGLVMDEVCNEDEGNQAEGKAKGNGKGNDMGKSALDCELLNALDMIVTPDRTPHVRSKLEGVATRVEADNNDIREEDSWASLERRHASLMAEIEGLEVRLERVRQRWTRRAVADER
ncbi:hypothetical protein EW146_g4296 [Bondarzewia mesenterica]|uniref:Uncharacterized protein n=1 Tax=Bondarzewia mesenterica TaxID=1095465 RepID=A0A4S4LV53_9AGAM|nr:hypothetical protein EW146_g4296 [Bondarzewia mesenterica]